MGITHTFLYHMLNSKSMKNFIFLLAWFINSMAIHGQQEKTTLGIAEEYHLLFEERGVKTKFIQLTEINGTKALLVASCADCYPAIYRYRPEESDDLGKNVFSAMGIYILRYDDKSYVAVLPVLGEETSYAFSNYYSTDKTNIQSMDKAKIEAYANKIF